MKKKTVKKVAVMAIAVLVLVQTFVVPASAENARYYKGWDVGYSTWDYQGSYPWNSGFLWLTSNEEVYFLSKSYYRCWTYYHDTWIANQGQTLSLNVGKTISNTISSTVTGEISATSSGSGAKLGGGWSTSTTTSYATSLGLTYNLKDYSNSSVRIASMGYVDRFYTERFINGSYNSSYYTFAYDTNYGQEITLVYR